MIPNIDDAKLFYDAQKKASAPTSPKGGRPKVTLSLVVDTVSFCLNVKQDHVLSRQRYAAACEARQWVYYVMSKAGLSPTKIGEKVGRDRSTVLHGLEKAEERMRTEEGRQVYKDIARYLRNPILRGYGRKRAGYTAEREQL